MNEDIYIDIQSELANLIDNMASEGNEVAVSDCTSLVVYAPLVAIGFLSLPIAIWVSAILNILEAVNNQLESQKRWSPESSIFDAKMWNMILGEALNYGTEEFKRVVKQNEDGTFDFTMLLEFGEEGNKYLSDYLKFVLGQTSWGKTF